MIDYRELVRFVSYLLAFAWGTAAVLTAEDFIIRWVALVVMLASFALILAEWGGD